MIFIYKIGQIFFLILPFLISCVDNERQNEKANLESTTMYNVVSWSLTHFLSRRSMLKSRKDFISYSGKYAKPTYCT